MLPVSASALDAVILTSSNIIPYASCVEGIKETLSQYSIKTIDIEKDLARGREALEDYRGREPRIVIAVGTQATIVLSEFQNFPLRLFCMMKNPEKELGPAGLYSGVRFSIPPSLQITTIKEAFPERTRVGIFYSKEYNQNVFDEYTREARSMDMTIVGFPITTANDIPKILKSKDFRIDVLLIIPERKIMSTRSMATTTKVIEYLIEESIRKRIPVVGYNRWFAGNGALLAFIVDYRDVGLQTGEMAERKLRQNEEGQIEIVFPRIRVFVNLKAANKLGVPVSPGLLEKADEVIR